MKLLEKLYSIINMSTGSVIRWTAQMIGTSFDPAAVALTDGAAIAVDGSAGRIFTITAANDNARAFSAPTNMEDQAIFYIVLGNTSGGALTVTTFNAAYHGTMTLPATAKQRTYMFRWDDTAGIAYQVVQSAADVTI